MKRTVGFVVSLVVCWGLYTCNAEASFLNLPVVNQLSNVVRCVITDVGTIASYWVGALATATTKTVTRVGQCLIYTAGQVTGVGDPDPLHTLEIPHG